TGASRCATSSPSLMRLLARSLRGAALEAIDPATRVDQLLPPGVERVAVRADLDVDLGLRRPRRELVAARAAHVSLDVLGVDVGLHGDVHSTHRPRRAGGLERTGERPSVVALDALVDVIAQVHAH